MASEIAWLKVAKYFSPSEFDDPHYPGSGKELNEELLYKLYQLRIDTDWPIIIHRWAGGGVDVEGSWGHAKNSYHLLRNGAKAADFHFDTDAPAREQIYEVMRHGFSGIGLYFDWKLNGKSLPIGFHVDVRPKEKFLVWKRINKKYIYIIP